jgi:Copper type II ascorbate-dependent monooxygenase, C-terminal domain
MRQLPWSITISACALAWFAGCGSGTPAATGNQPGASTPCLPGTLGCGTAGAGTPIAPATGGHPATTPAAAGSTGIPITTPPFAGAGAAAGTSALPPVGGSGALAGAGGVPCAVAKVVSDHCTLCHAAKPQAGAPMSLMTLADFHAPAKSNPAMTVAAIIPTRINATDQAKLMPPVNSTAVLAAADKTMFTTWLTGGAVAAATTDSCPITDATTMTGAAGGPAGTVSMGGTGNAQFTPIEYNDPEMKCYKFLSHAAGGDMTKPYSHGPGEEYVNFTYKAPWTGTVYTRAHKIAVGDAPILHHWLLYIDQTPGPDLGVAGNGTGIHLTSNLLHAWAPGASPIYFDPDVGMKLDSTVGVTLESHFNNATGATGMDNNGAEICVTTKVPAHVIDLTWTGTESIAGTSATGTCTPPSQMPIHIIAAQPHMHKTGIHMKVVINRKGGMKEVMHDDDFSFDAQKYYLINKDLMPGDTFTTTCTYSAPATFGQYTNNEMCYFFPFAWPAGAMASGGGIHGPTACLN